jgi:hypothetical protein
MDASRVDAFQFADCVLSRMVDHGLHAVAVDEQRADFTPTLWDDDARITQMLFPGAHSDVGGGYTSRNAHSGLSDGALRWMSDELAALGVRLHATPPFVPRPDFRGVAHQPWRKTPWDVLPRAARSFKGRFLQHESLRERMRCGPVACESDPPAAYAPANLPV